MTKNDMVTLQVYYGQKKNKREREGDDGSGKLESPTEERTHHKEEKEIPHDSVRTRSQQEFRDELIKHSKVRGQIPHLQNKWQPKPHHYQIHKYISKEPQTESAESKIKLHEQGMQMKKTKAKAIRAKLRALEERQRQSNRRRIRVAVVENPKHGSDAVGDVLQET